MAAEGIPDDLRVQIEELLKSCAESEKHLPKNVSSLDYVRRTNYHVTDFWRCKNFVSSAILDGNIIRKAFKDLCRLLSFSSLSREPSRKILNLACVLSTQLRSPSNHQALLVDQEKVKLAFCIDGAYSDSVEDLLITADNEKTFGELVYFRDFLASIDAMDEEEVVIFGPAFASAIVTLNKCSGRTVADKIFFMKSNLKKCYPMLSELKVRLPTKEVLIDVLTKNKGAHVHESMKNTVVLGFMFAYYKQDLTAEMKEMLDMLVLKCFRYSSMQLLTFVDEVTKAYGCSVDEYRQLTEVCHPGRCSWSAYDRFMAEFGPKQSVKEPDDSFWMFAREFDHWVFLELTYNNNPWLCNFSADLLDLKFRPDQVQPWPVLGPTFQNLTRYKRSKVPRLMYYEENHKYALEVRDTLNVQRQ